MLSFTSLHSTAYLALFSFFGNVHAGNRFCPEKQTIRITKTWTSPSQTVTLTLTRTVFLEAPSSVVRSTIPIVPRGFSTLPQPTLFWPDAKPTSSIVSIKQPPHTPSLAAILPSDDCPPSREIRTFTHSIGGGGQLLTVTKLIDVTIIRPVPEAQQTPASNAAPPIATTINAIGDQLPVQTSLYEQPSSLAAVPTPPGGVAQSRPAPNVVPPAATTSNKIGDQLSAQPSSLYEQASSVAPIPGPLVTQTYLVERPAVVGEPPLAITLYNTGGKLPAPTQTSTSLRWPDGIPMSSHGPLEGATQLIERPSAVLAPPSVEGHGDGDGELNGVPVVNLLAPAVPGAPNGQGGSGQQGAPQTNVMP